MSMLSLRAPASSARSSTKAGKEGPCRPATDHRDAGAGVQAPEFLIRVDRHRPHRQSSLTPGRLAPSCRESATRLGGRQRTRAPASHPRAPSRNLALTSGDRILIVRVGGRPCRVVPFGRWSILRSNEVSLLPAPGATPRTRSRCSLRQLGSAAPRLGRAHLLDPRRTRPDATSGNHPTTATGGWLAGGEILDSLRSLGIHQEGLPGEGVGTVHRGEGLEALIRSGGGGGRVGGDISTSDTARAVEVFRWSGAWEREGERHPPKCE